MKINYIISNVVETKTRPTVLVHSLSTTPAYDAGVAIAIRKKWPEAGKAHRQFYNDVHCYTDDNFVLQPLQETNCIECPFMLGEAVLVKVETNLYVANIIGQKGLGGDEYGPAVRYQALDEGMWRVAKACKGLGINTVSTVPMGTGLANGKVDKVLPLMWKRFCSQGIQVDLYDIKSNPEIVSLLSESNMGVVNV